MINIIVKISLISFISVILSFKAFAKSYNNISTNDVISEIEKTLLFDKESRKKIDVYKKSHSKKSDFVISSNGLPVPDDGFGEDSRSIEIIVVDPKSSSFELRKKEKMAYNASLIGQYEVAIQIFKEILRKEPKSQYSRFSLAVIYQQIGQLDKAKALYLGLLKENIENEDEIIGNLLAILIEQSPKDASYLLTRLSVQSPKSSYILAQAAVVYDKLKKYDEVISLLERAVFLDPANIGYIYNLAIAYDKIGKYEEALNKYGRVIDRFSDDDQNLIPINQVKARINAIRGHVW